MPEVFPFHLMDADLADALKRVWPVTLAAPDAQIAAVERRLAEVEAAASKRVFVDVDSARHIAHRLRQLVRATKDSPLAQREAVAAGVAYFCSDQDLGSDTDSMFGLEDDRIVLNAVLYFVKRARTLPE